MIHAAPLFYLCTPMHELRSKLHYRVVGIRRDGTRDARYCNLSPLTAEQVKAAMIQAQMYRQVVVEDQGIWPGRDDSRNEKPLGAGVTAKGTTEK
jgi:hypothetical protein